MRSDRSLKPSFFTYAALIREMDGVEGGALRLAAASDDTRVYAWSRGEEMILTAWALEGVAPFPLKLGKASVTDSFGHRREVDTSGMTLTVFPVYIRDMEGARELEPLLARARHEEERRKESQRRRAGLKAYLFDFGGKDHVGGFLIGDLRPSIPVVAGDTISDGKAHGFAPSAALQDDDQPWLQDALERDSCRVARGTQFRFRAEEGPYVLRVGVAPFEARGKLTVDGAAAGPITVEVTKESGVAEIEVEVSDRPISVEMDGYAALRWLALIQKE